MDKPQTNTAPPAAPPGKVRVDFLADAKAKAAEARAKNEQPKQLEQKPEVKPTEPPKVEQKPPEDNLAKSYEKLAQEREQIRKTAEEVKSQSARLASIERAIQAKDARTLLALAGITPEELARSISGATGEVEVSKTDEPKTLPELDELKKEIAALKAEREKERFQTTTTQLVNVVQNELKTLAEKLPYSAKLAEESAMQALEIMQKHFERTGQNLAEDARESMRLALELVEERHRAVVSKYGLTATQKEASIVPRAPEAPPAVESVALTQRDERPPIGGSQARPLTAADYRERVKAALRNKTLGG